MTSSFLLQIRLFVVAFFLLGFLYAALPGILALYLYTYGLYENGVRVW
ncbi:MAG: hypothetical protein V2G42_05420 [bacterium JZ-2024 1]